MINPIDNPDQIAAEREAIALMQHKVVQAGRQQVERLWRNAWADNIPDDVVAHLGSMIDEYLGNWVLKAVASDGRYPRFVRNFAPPHRWHGHDVPGSRACGENPDNIYRLAGIRHGGSYRVTGRPVGKEPVNVSFTLTGNYGTTVTVQTIEAHQLARADDRSFVITIDDTPANGRANHLTTAPNVKFIYVRDSMEDWGKETPLDLTIELVGKPDADPLNLDDLAREVIFRASEDVYLYHWYQASFLNIANNVVHNLPINRGTGGLVTQGLAKGFFSLGEDDAVLIEYEPAGATYVAVQLSSWLFRSLESDRLTSSLTRAQSVVSSDGKIRAVIARKDPGVANWLDCGNFRDVIYMHRWQGLPSTLVNGGPHVSARTVKLHELDREMPEGTIWFDAAARQAQIEMRKTEYARRFQTNDGS